MVCSPGEAPAIALQASARPRPLRIQRPADLRPVNSGLAGAGVAALFPTAWSFAGGFTKRKNTRSTHLRLARPVPRREDDVAELAEKAEEAANGEVGEFCLVPFEPEPEPKWANMEVDKIKSFWDLLNAVIFYILPLAGPAIAFWQWKNALQLVHMLLGDERLLLELMQVTLTPATNGIVIACLSIAFGTLTSLTISSLRQRQKEVRQCLNKEACTVALLQASLTTNSSACRRSADVVLYLQCLELLQMYVARISFESTSDACGTALQRLSVPDTELMGILSILASCENNRLAYTVYPPRDEACIHVTRLNDFRCDRLSSLNTGFPLLHWVVVGLLASSIGLCFLVEVDQSEGRFLAERPEDSLRLRLVFTIMIGSFCGLTALCADLNDPFRGSFNVSDSARQLRIMQEVLKAEIDQRRRALQDACDSIQKKRVA